MTETALCSRCGQSIKNVHSLDGKPFGLDCAASILGVAQSDIVFRDGVISRDATNQRREDAERGRAQMQSWQAEQDKKTAFYSQAHAKLIACLQEQKTAFCNTMAEYLTRGAVDDVLTERQTEAVLDIWARQFGRRNSKAYNTAYDAMIEEIEAAEANK